MHACERRDTSAKSISPWSWQYLIRYAKPNARGGGGGKMRTQLQEKCAESAILCHILPIPVAALTERYGFNVQLFSDGC